MHYLECNHHYLLFFPFLVKKDKKEKDFVKIIQISDLIPPIPNNDFELTQYLNSSNTM